jgi:hypothetical protein
VTACESCSAPVVDGTCTACGIYHDAGNPCATCGRAAWHKDDCPEAHNQTIDVDEDGDACEHCGGSAENIVGCIACCRDCGFPCEIEKDGEGFHADEDDDTDEDDDEQGEDQDERACRIRNEEIAALRGLVEELAGKLPCASVKNELAPREDCDCWVCDWTRRAGTALGENS